MEGGRTYFDILKEIFPSRSENVIENVIQIVEENFDPQDDKLEEMVIMLSESGESTWTNNSNDNIQDEAAGFGHNTGGYVLRGNKADSIFEQLSDMIPDADPDYLRTQAEILANKSGEELENFIECAVEKHDYPNKREYYKRQKSVCEVQSYTINFSVENYLNVIPEPFVHFNSSYKSVLCDGDDVVEKDEMYAVNSLLNLFPYLREKDIKRVFAKSKKNIIKACDTLARVPRHFKTPRKPVPIEDDCENIELLQELAFVKHKKELKTAIKMKDLSYRLARSEAEKYGLLETCQCCFFEGLLPEECYFCQKNCPFCKECVVKGAEHVIGKGEMVFPCLSNCNSQFDIATLKMVLDKKTFDPLFTKIQIDEVKKANIDGLETCPFCDFSMILSDREKIFKCQNIECMEETCRECRQKSHVPLRCNEIEYDEDVKRRTYIENKMTEALVRTCLQCHKSFFKESGCNKMTCPCGAKMCYICGTSINGYDHFGEISKNKCPLFTDNLKAFHAQKIISSAASAKYELGIDHNPKLLKKDPTEGLQDYFDTL